MTRKTRRQARPLTCSLIPLALAAVAAPAFAGGVYLDVKAQVAPGDDGAVDLTVTFQRAECDCYPTIYLDAAADGVGPALTVERLEGSEWKPVEVAWALRMKPEEAVAPPAKPEPLRAFRLDWGCALSVRKPAQLPPGTYRVAVVVRVPEAAGDWTLPRTSKPFVVGPAPRGPARQGRTQ